jgi:MerR family mercuric resistance operon transcriptional regulator
MRHLTIGQLADSAGVPTSTVRYYERSGLLKPDERSAGGNYRQYHARSVEKLKFIRSAQAVGLSLKEVADLLRLTDEETSPCDEVMAALRRRLDEVREKLKDLKRIERTLTAALDNCCQSDGAPSLCHQVERLKRA